MISPLLAPLAEGTVPVVHPAAAGGAFTLLWLVIALPALGAAVLLLGGRRTDRWGHLLGCATVGLSFLLSLVMFVTLVGRDAADRSVGQHLWTWFTAGNYTVQLDLLYDPLSALFLLLITGVGGLIHVQRFTLICRSPELRPRIAKNSTSEQTNDAITVAQPTRWPMRSV